MLKDLQAYNELFDTTERKKLVALSLSNFRRNFGYKKTEVAEMIGINVSTYAAYESGRNEPPIEVLVRLAILYDTSIDVIAQKDNDKKDKLNTIEKIEILKSSIDSLKKELAESDEKKQKHLTPLVSAGEKLVDSMEVQAKKSRKKLEKKQ